MILFYLINCLGESLSLLQESCLLLLQERADDSGSCVGGDGSGIASSGGICGHRSSVSRSTYGGVGGVGGNGGSGMGGVGWWSRWPPERSRPREQLRNRWRHRWPLEMR